MQLDEAENIQDMINLISDIKADTDSDDEEDPDDFIHHLSQNLWRPDFWPRHFLIATM